MDFLDISFYIKSNNWQKDLIPNPSLAYNCFVIILKTYLTFLIMLDILQIASKEIGVTQIEGPQHNERILQYASDIGMTWINDDETPWCSIFMNWVAKKAGYSMSNNAAARSWLNVGRSIEDPEPGDIVVFWRNGRDSHFGHVGVFTGVSLDGTRIYSLGGNQMNSVTVSAYSKERLLSFRRLNKIGEFQLSERVLEIGDRGREVAVLQDALKTLGFDVGTSDGIFGPKTERSVKDFQSTYLDLEITGVFDIKSRVKMLALLAH